MATSRLIRFFSRRQIKNQESALNRSNSKFLSNGKIHTIDKSQQIVSIKSGFICTVIFLDGENINFEVDRKALGKSLYDKVIAHTKLVESDYFGLQFIDPHNIKQWLDPTKPIKKQCKIGPPYTFRFRVKFYSSDPQNLHDEYTRYLFVLQLKDDVRTGRLECPPDLGVELAALNLQGEIGDYINSEHSIDIVSDFSFLPDNEQTEEFEEQVLEKWKTYKGLTPADSEMQYLSKARWLEMYGVDLHRVMGKDGLEYKLGLTPTGILVFENMTKIGLFIWSKITRINFNRSKLTIVVMEDDDNDPHVQRDFVFLFRCYDEKQCKHFWKCALEHHVFFRTISTKRLKQDFKTNLTRTGSRFRFSGRTECQTTVLGNLITNRSTNFERKASQRFSRRASYAIRKKLEEHEILREQEDERLKQLKFEQETKLNESKTRTNSENVTNLSKRSSSQKNLTATQRLDNLIQGGCNDLFMDENELQTSSINVPSAPVVHPRQTKFDDNTQTSLVPVKLSDASEFSLLNKKNNTNIKSFRDDHDQTLSIQMSSSQKTPVHLTNGHSSKINHTNTAPKRYVLASSQATPHVTKETLFYDETIATKKNMANSPNPLIVTRTLSQSNVRNASSTIIQTTNATSKMLSSSQLTQIHPQIMTRNSSSSISFPSTFYQSYHPLTTEL